MKNSSMGCVKMMVETNKPYLGMLLIQLIYVGMALLSKASITKGMNPYVFVVYRQALATLALFPFAFFLERYAMNSTNKFTPSLLLCITHTCMELVP